MVVTHRGGAPAAKAAIIHTTGGSYDLTTDARQPNYNVDSGSGTNPRYEARGLHIQDAKSLAIFDAPSSLIDTVTGAEKADRSVTKIESRAHFDSYLVINGKVCARISWVVSYTWTSAANATTGPAYTIDRPDTSGGSPNEGELQAMFSSYPDQQAIH